MTLRLEHLAKVAGKVIQAINADNISLNRCSFKSMFNFYYEIEYNLFLTLFNRDFLTTRVIVTSERMVLNDELGWTWKDS
jgi:hypothetical protein